MFVSLNLHKNTYLNDIDEIPIEDENIDVYPEYIQITFFNELDLIVFHPGREVAENFINLHNFISPYSILKKTQFSLNGHWFTLHT